MLSLPKILSKLCYNAGFPSSFSPVPLLSGSSSYWCNLLWASREDNSCAGGQGLMVFVGLRAGGQLFSWLCKKDSNHHVAVHICRFSCQSAEHHNGVQQFYHLLCTGQLQYMRVAIHPEGGLWLQETKVILPSQCQHAERQLLSLSIPGQAPAFRQSWSPWIPS